jgi:aminoglycoside 2'-N-acetyltransferase I
MHAFAWDGAVLVGHGAIVARRLVHDGRALRTGYVEGVAVHANHRRRGVASALMTALERIARGGYDVGALSASEDAVPLYAGRGWQRWQGATWAMTPKGPERTEEDDDAVYVLPVTAPLDLTGDLTCDWRDGDVW